MRRCAPPWCVLALSGCFGPDKLLHAGAGALTGAVADETVGYGCEAAIAVGLVKELVDPIFDPFDLIATAAYCLIPSPPQALRLQCLHSRCRRIRLSP